MRRPQTEVQQEALSNAIGRQSTMNYEAIITGFMAMGIPAADIKPRETVFTYHAWRALGRNVRKGEHGVRVLTFVPCAGKVNETTGERSTYRKPHGTTVFHVSQTNAIGHDAAIRMSEILDSNAEVAHVAVNWDTELGMFSEVSA